MEEVCERFLRYIAFDTASDENSHSIPSTKSQLAFGKTLVRELLELGLKQCTQDKNGYVMATLPANIKGKIPVIGLIAHLDTSSECSGCNIRPHLIKNYPGGDILLNDELGIYLLEAEFPELKKYYGQDLITTDGTTLLGADDKAGIAEIVTAMAYLLKHPEIEHGPIRLAFTPDEEIGRGCDHFNLEKFGADFAYTIDGGELGQLETENFNAATATFTIHGKSVHPGTAKNKMINSVLVALELIDMFPANEIPAKTEGYEGFFHLINITGTVEQTVLKYIIRDHDLEIFERRKGFAESCAGQINRKYNAELVKLEIKDTYYNMKEILEQHPHVPALAEQAMRDMKIEPLKVPIRGGTDGARLSFMGLPTPNLFTGGHNFHGRYEFIPVQSMQKAVETIVRICELA